MSKLIFLLAATTTGVVSVCGEKVHAQPRAVDNRHIFNPRMDYDEWKPLGRGDPLKNDPTYDYVPPVLDRVHYWMDPRKRTPDPPLPNAGVMVLGASTDEPSTTVPATSRLGTMNLIDPFLKFMQSSKESLGFSTQVTNYFRPTPNPPLYVQPTHKPNYVFYGPPPSSPEHTRSQELQRPPYTMLMPPPPPPPPLLTSTDVPITSFGTTIKSTTEAEEEITTTTEEAVTNVPSSTQVTSTTNLANSENYYKPVAINMPEDISNETKEIKQTTIPFNQGNDETLPLVSLFNVENDNNIQYQEVKLPSMVMVPPQPQEANNFFEFRPTTVRTTTTSRTLTTDPMFKHYKQPSEFVRGPFYLIIQGHSKVKTYGASKNKMKPLSSNEINYEEGKARDDNDLVQQESYRRERKLQFNEVIDEDNAEIVEGHPTIELSASFKTKSQAGFSVSDNETTVESLEVAFPNSSGGSSKKRLLVNNISRRKRSPGMRTLLSTVPIKEKVKERPNLDKDQLGLESLIALSDDYNSEDVLNLLLKQEGQGSGFGGLVSSLLGRSLQTNEEM